MFAQMKFNCRLADGSRAGFFLGGWAKAALRWDEQMPVAGRVPPHLPLPCPACCNLPAWDGTRMQLALPSAASLWLTAPAKPPVHLAHAQATALAWVSSGPCHMKAELPTDVGLACTCRPVAL